MSADEDLAVAVAEKLSRLLAEASLNKEEKLIASTCLRRLQQPLRAAIFGTHPKHAISLLNLLAGQSLVPPILNKAHIRIVYSARPYAEVQLRDGRVLELKETEFRDIFADRPEKVKIGVNLPVLKKVAFMVIANPDASELCANQKALCAADFVLWSGDALTEPMVETWAEMPERIRDHSHLVLSPTMEQESWAAIQDEFVSVLTVDPRLAQAAKTRKGGADKAGFESSGGIAIVRAIKKEIESLQQSALDAAQVLLFRHQPEPGELSEPEPEEQTGPRRARFSTTRKPTEVVVSIDSAKSDAGIDDEVDDRLKPATPWSLGL